MNLIKKLLISKYILTVVLFTVSLMAFGQDYIDEDFLEKLSNNAKPMLLEENPAFNISIVPSKWDKQSAVVIGYSRSIFFDRQSRGGFLSRKERSLWFLEKDRFRIKLNDNNSVQIFSQIYFRFGAKEDGFIARIIKQDGSLHSIDLKSAVAVENPHDVPEFFQSFFDKVAGSDYKYFKVAVPDLEPGDILEYVANTKSKLDVTSSGSIEFAPIYEVCSKSYPVLFNHIVIETDNNTYFKYESMNGAPKFKKENTSENGMYRYVFEDHDRSTEKDVNFISPLLNYPVVKFQVIYSNSDKAKGLLIGEKGELKNAFTKEQLARKAWENYEMSGEMLYAKGTRVQDFINACWSELVKMDGKTLPEKQYIDKAYYLIRNKIVYRDTYFNDKIFAYVFGSLLYQRNIKSDLIITIGNDMGTLNDVLFDDEIRYAIKIGDKIYFNATDFSTPGDLNETLLDNDAYIIYEPAKKTGAQEIKPFKLPGTTYADNSENVTFKTQMSPDMKDLMVIRTSAYTGIQKSNQIAGKLKYTTYIFDDYKNYGGDPPDSKMKGKEADEYYNSVKALKDEYKKRKEEYVKQTLESEYSYPLKEIHYELESDGRTAKKQMLIVKEGFQMKGFVRKAGKKYLLNLPGLIGGQFQIKKEERIRTYDIEMRYPRSFNWVIDFQVPDGYTADGLKELNTSIENETGKFSIDATQENGTVHINITKIYKQRLISKEKWKDLISVLETAYNSSFGYILLKPKN